MTPRSAVLGLNQGPEPPDLPVVGLDQTREELSVEGLIEVRRNGHQRNTPMKTNHLPPISSGIHVCESNRGRPVSSLSRISLRNLYPRLSTDSDVEAIEAFILEAPADEGGDVRVLDQTEQRMIAFVKWKIARTEIGLRIGLRRERVTTNADGRSLTGFTTFTLDQMTRPDGF